MASGSEVALLTGSVRTTTLRLALAVPLRLASSRVARAACTSGVCTVAPPKQLPLTRASVAASSGRRAACGRLLRGLLVFCGHLRRSCLCGHAERRLWCGSSLGRRNNQPLQFRKLRHHPTSARMPHGRAFAVLSITSRPFRLYPSADSQHALVLVTSEAVAFRLSAPIWGPDADLTFAQSAAPRRCHCGASGMTAGGGGLLAVSPLLRVSGCS